MLPRMNGVKTCAFTRRIIAFNETFAELGKAKNNSTVVWNESVSGGVLQIFAVPSGAFLRKNSETQNKLCYGATIARLRTKTGPCIHF